MLRHVHRSGIFSLHAGRRACRVNVNTRSALHRINVATSATIVQQHRTSNHAPTMIRPISSPVGLRPFPSWMTVDEVARFAASDRSANSYSCGRVCMRTNRSGKEESEEGESGCCVRVHPSLPNLPLSQDPLSQGLQSPGASSSRLRGNYAGAYRA